MENITINISALLYYVVLYYIVFNIITIIDWISDDEKITKTNILNPFREKACFLKYILLGLATSIPYLLLLALLQFIEKYNFIFKW